ncbi:MAG TPA: hypothetical protein VIV40_15505 [Kofleriaceae bacterium]
MAERRFTDLELERQLAGDLPALRAFDTQASDADRARLAELRAEHEAFLRTVDVGNEVLRIQQRVARAAPEKRVWWRWLVPAGALAAAAAVVLVLLRRGSDQPHNPDDDFQVKGDEISLVVHVATESGSRRVTTGDDVAPGDKLRFEVNAAKPGYIAVVGIDGSGQLSIYHPGNGSGPIEFDPHARLLPGAIKLDATPGDEHFYALYSPAPFAFDIVLPALQENRSLPAGISKTEVVLKKKVAP